MITKDLGTSKSVELTVLAAHTHDAGIDWKSKASISGVLLQILRRVTK
jgi:hypothetical protein